MDAQSAADEKFAAVLTELEQRQNRTTVDLSVQVPHTSDRSEKFYRTDKIRVPKPHQPRFLTETCHVSNQQHDNPLLLFTAKIENTGKNNNDSTDKDTTVSTFLLDCGASRDFISQTVILKYKLKTEVLPQKVRIILADGRNTVATHQCQIKFTVHSAQFTRTCIVINMNSEYDVILGMPFLTDINPEINWKLKHWKTPDMIFPKTCEYENRNICLNIISANKMTRLIKKDKDPSTKYFLAVLKKEYDLVELNALT